MTTVYREMVLCSLCEEKTEYTLISSTNTFGGLPDLDSRPPERKRSTIFAWVQRCPECGYCASNISTPNPEAQSVILCQEYKDQLNDPAYPELAASFLCKAILDRESEDFAAATGSLIHAAWVCDDSGNTDEAQACRLKAADMLLFAESHGQQVSTQNGATCAVLVDLLRRSGRVDQARKEITARRGGITEEIIIEIMDYQEQLIERNDVSCHTLGDAREEIKLKNTKNNE